MTYKQALKYLDSFYDYEKSISQDKGVLTLSRMKKLDNMFKSPHKSYPIIHIAGTKGKGSTAYMLAFILQKTGYKVGLYTSPHLNDVRERIQVNKKRISKTDFTRLMETDQVYLLGDRPGLSPKPTYFEILTMIAFLYFKTQKVDIAIIETGLGGRFDATNIIKPIISVITDISKDHIKELGNTLEKIAYEKAGIIKKGVPCVSSSDKKTVVNVIKEQCRKKGARYIKSRDNKQEERGKRGEFQIEHFGLKGEHQKRNMQTVLTTIKVLKDKGFSIKDEDIKSALSNISIPGRFEIIKSRGKKFFAPTTILDCAHNKESAVFLCRTLKEEFPNKEYVFILGILNNKDIKGICSEFSNIAKEFVLIKPDNPRASESKELAKHLKEKKIYIEQTSEKAYNKAKEISGKNGVIVVTGSFYLVGQLRGILVK
ncbi:MAG: bifunctional folylpolyglutamate synthase/dihydrofolate synthase [Candidatus Omnitrophica bacterium]|nr:bifunctional folylpolyglutamate synthase/dihydrofolate synthase [Candidatus Omnitrophota bacterium]